MVSKRVQELLTIEGFDYLGYRFSHSGLTTTAKFERNLKVRVSRLINIYLLDYLKYGHNADRCSANRGFDWDLLGLIYEVRRVIYGGLSEAEIQNFLHGVGKFRRVKGLMGFYCLIEDANKLRDMDGWIVSMVRRAMRTRNGILQANYSRDCPTPTNLQLIAGDWLNLSAWRTPSTVVEHGAEDESLPEVQFPSLVRGWRAARKHYYTFGLENVEAPKYVEYSDLSLVIDY